MRIAITGGTGFIGGHLARRLSEDGHELVLIARGLDHRNPDVWELPGARVLPVGIFDESALTDAMAGCDAVVHCAGINRESGGVTFHRAHVQGTLNVAGAARHAGVKKIVLISFLRARPRCGSPYHESKWRAEEIVRRSGLDYTIFKPGVVYGRGDHMLDHLSHAFHTFPVFAFVGMRDRGVRPLAVEDLVRALVASLTEERLSNRTFAVMGPEQLTLSDAVRRVAEAVGRKPRYIRMPVAAHRAMAWCLERVMTVPLISVAQVRILSEGLTEPLPFGDLLPEDLAPTLPFSEDQIRRGLPEPKGFGLADCRLFAGQATEG